MLSFGERLRKARERKGLSQIDVYKAIGLNNKSLSRYETGATAPDPDTVRDLIRLYDVSSNYILGLSEVMGHASDFSGSSLSAPKVAADPSVIENLDGLSDEGKKKAAEYIEMLKTLDEVKSGENLVDFGRKV